MSNQQKTRQQLIEELDRLHQRIANLQAALEQAEQEIDRRKRAEQKLADQAKQAELLHQVRMALTHDLELSTLFQTSVEIIANTFDYPLVSLFWTHRVRHQVGYNSFENRLSASQQISQRVTKSGRPLFIEDLRLDPQLGDALTDNASEICVPLFDQGKAIGSLNIGGTAAKPLGKSDLHLAITLAGYIDIAVERAQLYTEEREGEEKYRTLIEQSNDAIYLIYGNRFEIINRKFEQLFGVTKEEVASLDFVFDKIVAPKSRRLIVEGALTGDDRPSKISPLYEFTALDKDGNEIEVELSVSYPAYKGGLATQGVLRDITERKRAEAERAAMQAQMFQNAKLASVGELAAGIAHEINNPIFAIREYADLMLEDTPQSHPHHSMLETIIGESNRIAEIVRNLLEFSRPGETDFTSVQIKDVWQRVYKLINKSFYKHDIQLEVDIPADLPPVKARGQQLQQVLLNLVTNAQDSLREKSSPGMSDRPQNCIVIAAKTAANVSNLKLPDGRPAPRALEISVKDNGPGILPQHRERLFTPFFTTKRAKGGTGLGLSISHKIIEEHHGLIKVKSEPGRFAEFTIILPVESEASFSTF